VSRAVALVWCRVCTCSQTALLPQDFADDNYLPYVETSAKTNVNVIQAFETLAQAALREK